MKAISRMNFVKFIKFKHKLFFLILFIILLVCSATMIAFQYIYQTYDEQLYHEAAKTINLSSAFIEKELNKIERLSYNMIADPLLQEYLVLLKEENNEYIRFRIGNRMEQSLASFYNSENIISSIQLIDVNGYEYSLGIDIMNTGRMKLDEIFHITTQKEGNYTWISPELTDGAVLLARDIRSYKNLDLETLGTILIRINVDKMVSKILKDINISKDSFHIFYGSESIYPHFASSQIEIITQHSFQNNQGYEISKSNGHTVFKTYLQSDKTDWTYVNLVPYDRIFNSIIIMKNLVLSVFVFLFIIVIYLAIDFSRGITRPIESLNEKIKTASMSHLKYSSIQKNGEGRIDEVGQLDHNFNIMTEKINELVTENYSKQLTIKETEYKALQAQINPHFLYNTLESINWLAKINSQSKISEMVESLGFLLRRSISRTEYMITIREEIQIIQNYITIQRIRFEDRLDYQLNIPDEFHDCLIPKLSLQPIVENSIYYALDHMIEPCRISITAAGTKDLITLSVADNGPGMDIEFLEKLRRWEVKSKGTGIGLKNIDERIKHLFGKDFGIHITSVPNQETKVSVSIPYRLEDKEHVQGIASGR